MSDDSFSFTPIKINLSPTPYKSVRRHIFVTNDVQVLLAKNMSPFREQYTSPYLAKPSIKNELNIQQIVDKLDAKQYMTDSLNEICEAAINSQNLICSHQMTVIERSLLFQMLTLLIPDGLVIVISNFYILLKERLKKIKDTVSWAAINPEVNQQQIDFILSNIYQKGLQLLIIHPDSLAQVEISGLNAKLLVLDQANFYLPQLEITKTSQDLTKKIQGIDFQNIHILIPHVQEAFIRELQDLKFFGKQYQIYRQRYQLKILSKFRIDNLKTQITSSRDEQPIKQLFQLLRGSRVFKKTGILVYVSNNQVENICQQMQLNGFRVGSVSLTKNEQVRQQIYYDFAANNLDIIVLPSGFLLPEGFKNYVYLSVHLYIPLNIESFLLDIYELNPEANSHIFLCDQYYFDLRNEICKSFIKISSIDKLFHEKIYLKESLQVDQFDLKYYLTNKYHHQEQQQESRLKKLLLSETSTYLGISKSTFMNILQSLEDYKWIEIQFQMPYEAIIYLNDEDNALTANIQAFGKKNLLKSANGFKCKIDDLARVMSLSNNQIINQLKQDNLKYEIVEEALLIKLVYLPSLQEMKAKMLDIYTNLKRQILIKLNNLDQSYILFKEYSFKSLDYMWKQIQLRDNDKISQSLISHLNMDKFNEVDVEKLPFQKLDTQREKSTLLADIKQIYDKSKPKEQGWIERENFATKSLMILMGLKPNEQGLQEWKSTTLWGKYKQFNYTQVHSIIHTWLEQQSEKECLQIKKKIKL